MRNFAENLNLGNRFRPPLLKSIKVIVPSIVPIFIDKKWNKKKTPIFFLKKFSLGEQIAI